MSIQKELETLIKDDVLVEIEDYIDDLFEIIASKKDDDEIKAELLDMQEMKKEFESLLVELENGELSDEECEELIEEINTMKEDNLIEED
ncbi:hypothetical protein [Aliarcobacter vitoriensis]|uniref:Uncharacterized protein n=1 Tax=Aliarcobacter vitoriensis TaxID=2011099 RepID=A0A366MVR0_9BACT|nr:hypothetical protein [Aliarcobacter vitoriensis]RBQ29684.1 hypothetical protein CRU91_03545 [Aliarcobacter vitoriensis]RBQ30595.1 hypothetical protein CRU92_11260 [Arcobacter sp. FW59]